MTTLPLVSLSAVAHAARLAGERIMEWYERPDLSSTAKADSSPVTQADLAAHEILSVELPKLMLGVPVISEETASDEAATVRAVAETPCFWLIDPLDGTRDFLAHTGDFSVNIALMIDGEPVLGCVFAPAHGICYLATRELGAFVQERPGGPLTTIRTRIADKARFVCLVSRSHEKGEGKILHSLFPLASVRAVGSAWKYAQIAAGQADIAVRKSPTSLWDTAAAQCVLESAGGMMVDFAGVPLRYRTGSLINPPFVAVGDLGWNWRETLKQFNI